MNALPGKKIFVCSPYRGDTERNVQFARAFCSMVVESGFRPSCPHLLYPQFLDDDLPDERELARAFALADLKSCEALWWALPPGYEEPSEGMRDEIQEAEKLELAILKVEVR